jgi:hypothetical protein
MCREQDISHRCEICPSEEGTSCIRTPEGQGRGHLPLRGCQKDTIGIRHRTGKEVDLLKVAGISVSQSITRAVKDYFTGRGFEVTDCKGWDKSPEGLAHLPQDLSLVVGGTIESFTVDARSGVVTTEIHYRVKMAVSIGQIKERKVVIRTVDSAPQTKKISFDPGKVGATLNQTLTEVIESLFK